mgnify:CR=1 FL=1
MATKKTAKQAPLTVIVRGSNGTYVGTLESRSGREVSIVDARWLYSWTGRLGLATLAAVGPGVADMSCPAPRVWVLDAYAVLECSEAAARAFAAIVSK